MTKYFAETFMPPAGEANKKQTEDVTPRAVSLIKSASVRVSSRIGFLSCVLMLFQAAILLLANSAAAFIGHTGRLLPSPSIAMAASDADVCPPRLPTFGLSEREQIRFRYMVLRSEPLPHEIFGLQVLLGAIGTQLAGFVGFIFGSCQIAPCVSWLPGTVGDKFRATGWLTFSSVRSACMWTSSVWRETGLHVRHTASFPFLLECSPTVDSLALAGDWNPSDRGFPQVGQREGCQGQGRRRDLSAAAQPHGCFHGHVGSTFGDAGRRSIRSSVASGEVAM